AGRAGEGGDALVLGEHQVELVGDPEAAGPGDAVGERLGQEHPEHRGLGAVAGEDRLRGRIRRAVVPRVAAVARAVAALHRLGELVGQRLGEQLLEAEGGLVELLALLAGRAHVRRQDGRVEGGEAGEVGGGEIAHGYCLMLFATCIIWSWFWIARLSIW